MLCTSVTAQAECSKNILLTDAARWCLRNSMCNRGSTHTESLSQCGCPEWSINKVKLELEARTHKKKKKNRLVQDHKPSMIIPYVVGVSEAVARVYSSSRYSLYSYETLYYLKNLLVHPIDNRT